MPGLGARRDFQVRGRMLGLGRGSRLTAPVLEQKHGGGDDHGYHNERYQGTFAASGRRLASVDCFTSTCQCGKPPQYTA
ncbi:hypothetical protein GMLC_38760 [Geomonas limicola]|uniref:Uncharacterized protein n=1 Tax=Geomonas limicola TaxID=2740186 RepID=A0A6V8NEU5_9BACT|nr:hypothetical protein GMLC_38760 [Geomonas limicola]